MNKVPALVKKKKKCTELVTRALVRNPTTHFVFASWLTYQPPPGPALTQEVACKPFTSCGAGGNHASDDPAQTNDELIITVWVQPYKTRLGSRPEIRRLLLACLHLSGTQSSLLFGVPTQKRRKVNTQQRKTGQEKATEITRAELERGPRNSQPARRRCLALRLLEGVGLYSAQQPRPGDGERNSSAGWVPNEGSVATCCRRVGKFFFFACGLFFRWNKQCNTIQKRNSGYLYPDQVNVAS